MEQPPVKSEVQQQTLRFGTFEVDPHLQELRKQGVRVRLPAQSIQILVMLLETPGKLVNREELRNKLWPQDTFVDFDHGVNAAINRLREALGDSAEKPKFIETLPRRGYRFIAPVDGSLTPSVAPSERRVLPYIAKVTALAATVVCVAALGYWLGHRQPFAIPPLKERQATFNSVENSVTQGVISPDGRYLAYGDQKGMHLMLIRTGETTSIPQPSTVSPDNWWPNRWFPDSTKFITAGWEAGHDQPSTWVVSAMGGMPRKIRDDADPSSVSPDGALIAFGGGFGPSRWREIWLMGPQGEDGRRFVSRSEDDAFFQTAWSPDGQRIAYQRYHRTPDRTECLIESRDLRGGQPTVIVSDPGLCNWIINFLWLPDGRFLYMLLDPPLRRYINLWEIRVDTKTGEPISAPRQITNWTNVVGANLSITADEKQLAITKLVQEADVYVGELEANGRHIANIRRLTLNEKDDFLGGWTADSRAVLFWSNRNGNYDIYKQALDQTDAEPVVTGSDHKEQPVLSPDGSWILYLSSTTEDVQGASPVQPATPVRIMRVPTSGGASQLVLEGRGIDHLACAQAPAMDCIFSEPTSDRKQLVLSRFDPIHGRGKEVTRLDFAELNSGVGWDLSRDGSRLAVARCCVAEDRIRIVPLSGEKASDVNIRGWDSVLSLSWADDGKSLVVAVSKNDLRAVVRVDLNGRAQVIWQAQTTYLRELNGCWVLSPNARYVAVTGYTLDHNVWLLENF